MKVKYTLAALAATSLAASAAITTQLDTSGFTNQYDGDDIYDGTNFINGWTKSAAGITGSLTDSTLTLTTPGGNGWIEHAAGDDFNGPLTNGWTIETTLTMTGGEGLVLWADGANNGTGGQVYLGANGIGILGNGSETDQSLSSTSNIGTHTFRVAYDINTSLLNVWRDGVLVSDTVAAVNPGGGPRLIVGDCCSNVNNGVTLDTLQIENISYDITGGFAPVPEPSSTALLGLGGLALILRRRK